MKEKKSIFLKDFCLFSALQYRSFIAVPYQKRVTYFLFLFIFGDRWVQTLLWWNALWINLCFWSPHVSQFFFSPQISFFSPQRILNQHILLDEGWKLLFQETQLQLDNRKQMPIICQWLLENKTFYDIYFALAELLLMPKKYKRVKLPAAGFQMGFNDVESLLYLFGHSCSTNFCTLILGVLLMFSQVNRNNTHNQYV